MIYEHRILLLTSFVPRFSMNNLTLFRENVFLFLCFNIHATKNMHQYLMAFRKAGFLIMNCLLKTIIEL